MTSLPNSIKEKIAANPVFRAALCHPTARPEAFALLADSGFHADMLDAWNTFGKSVIATYAARITLNSTNSISIGEAAEMIKTVSGHILTILSQRFRNDALAIFGKAITEVEKKNLSPYTVICHQVIGAIAFIEGYSVVAVLLENLFGADSLSCKIGKDSKTMLQELTQKKERRLPSYEQLKTPKRSPTHEFWLYAVSRGN